MLAPERYPLPLLKKHLFEMAGENTAGFCSGITAGFYVQGVVANH